MKKSILFLFIILLVSACKNDSKSKNTENTEIESESKYPLISGEFIYYGDVAVLQTTKKIYGVIIDEKMHELNQLVKKYKVEDTDMIPVQIRGEIIAKLEGKEGWPQNVEIKEILSVFEPKKNSNDLIKIGNKQSSK